MWWCQLSLGVGSAVYAMVLRFALCYVLRLHGYVRSVGVIYYLLLSHRQPQQRACRQVTISGRGCDGYHGP